MTRPIYSRQEYMALRDSDKQKELVAKARAGDGDAKRKLVQFNYSCIPGEDGKLKGCKVASTSVGMDVDFDVNDPDYKEKMAKLPELILSKKDALGLLMGEFSCKKGVHIVFKRREGLTQEENLQWASDLLGVKYDEGAKDITRVFFTTTGSQDDLFFLDDELFSPTPMPLPRAGSIMGTGSERIEPSEVTSGIQTENTPLPMGEGFGGRAVDGTGIDYDSLVPEIIKKMCSTYPIVPQGRRNSTLYDVCDWLRYVCEFSAEKLKAVLYPKFTYGLPESEVDSTIRSALTRERYRMPKELQKMVDRNISAQENGEEAGEAEEADLLSMGDPYAIYPSLASCVVQDMALPKLPRWVDTLLKVTLPGYRFITLCGVAPAMMTLLSDVFKKNGSKAPARLNGWSHWSGLSGSGKHQLKVVVAQLIKPIKEEDNRKRERLNSIIAFNQTAKDGEKKEVPVMGFRILECDTTRKAHAAQMEALKGKKTYTFAEELSSLNLNRAGYYYRADFCRLFAENGMVGYLNATNDSKSILTECNWDVTTTSTHDQTLAQWAKDVQNGAAQRILFCLVPDNTWQPKPKEVQWSEEDIAYLDRATSLMMKMQGLVLTPRLDKALDDWVENVRVSLMSVPKGQRNVERARFRFRTAEIAHTFCVVLHCCYIVQAILDMEDSLSEKIKVKSEKLAQLKQDVSATCEEVAQAEREVIEAQEALEKWKLTALDLSQYGENKQCADLATYVADYCLDMQDRMWSKRLRAQLLTSCEGVSAGSGRTKSEDDYEKMPLRFTLKDLESSMNWKSLPALRKMVERLIKCNLLKRAGREGKLVIYEKTVA